MRASSQARNSAKHSLNQRRRTARPKTDEEAAVSRRFRSRFLRAWYGKRSYRARTESVGITAPGVAVGVARKKSGFGLQRPAKSWRTIISSALVRRTPPPATGTKGTPVALWEVCAREAPRRDITRHNQMIHLDPWRSMLFRPVSAVQEAGCRFSVLSKTVAMEGTEPRLLWIPSRGYPPPRPRPLVLPISVTS